MAGTVWSRVYSDFLMPPRLEEYRSLLAAAAALGYEFHSIRSFLSLPQTDADDRPRCLILRHDIDTDPATAALFLALEQELGARASYYFRLSTVDVDLMRRVEAGGGEASYHFEEIATVAKQRRLRSRGAVLAHMAEIQDLFERNLLSLRRQTGLTMITVASHGDFVNRFLEMPNWELLSAPLRTALGIIAETYDVDLARRVSSRYCDDQYPRFWSPASPYAALARGERTIYLLTHPRHWRRNSKTNIVDNLRRLTQGIRYAGWRSQTSPTSTDRRSPVNP